MTASDIVLVSATVYVIVGVAFSGGAYSSNPYLRCEPKMARVVAWAGLLIMWLPWLVLAIAYRTGRWADYSLSRRALSPEEGEE